ncbi:MAG: HAMP domain-containing sensor histidine kinase, partial [Bacteroidales bacterium]
NIELSANQLNEKKLKVIREIPVNIHVYADKNMINTVLRNLLTNAIKFSQNGDIRITVAKSDNLVVCRISDSGVGITESRLKTIFEIDNSKSTEGTKGESGTGLGLIICKEFVEKNRGKISVESEEGKGSTFSFTIPIIL